MGRTWPKTVSCNVFCRLLLRSLVIPARKIAFEVLDNIYLLSSLWAKAKQSFENAYGSVFTYTCLSYSSLKVVLLH